MAENGISIGLDIDEKSVKFVRLKQADGKIYLQKYAVHDIPASTDRIKAVSDILKNIFKGEKPDSLVYTCAYGTNVSLKRMTIPVIPDDEISDALKWEAKNLIPFPVENAAIDFFKIDKVSDKTTDKYNIMFAAAGEDLISFLEAVSSQSQIKISGISLVPFALFSILETGKIYEKDKISAIIDIGAEAASINLFKGNSLQFTREITVAGDSLTKAMTGLLVADHWQLNLTYEQAEEIKKNYGIPKKDTAEVTESGIPLIHIYEMMAPTLRRLQNEILRSFDYYKEEFREEKIDNIYLTGGSSSLKNLEEFLTNALGIKVRTIDPLENIKIEPSSGMDLKKLSLDAPRLALAMGLALEKGGKINFKKAHAKKKHSAINIKFFELFKLDGIAKNFRIRMPANVTIWLFLISLIAGVTFYYYLLSVKNGYNKELASKQLILGDVKALAERRAILDQIAKEETHLRETLSHVTRSLPNGISLSNLTYDNTKRQIWLTGDASDTKSVGSLLNNLEDSPNFRSVILIEARKTMVEGTQKILFKVTFNLT